MGKQNQQDVDCKHLHLRTKGMLARYNVLYIIIVSYMYLLSIVKRKAKNKNHMPCLRACTHTRAYVQLIEHPSR